MSLRFMRKSFLSYIFLPGLVLCIPFVKAPVGYAQTVGEVAAKGREFGSCLGCDAQIYFYNQRWYDIEREGGFVSPGRPPGFSPILHPLTGSIKWISSNVVYWDGNYHCAYDSIRSTRRDLKCTSKGWVGIK